MQNVMSKRSSTGTTLRSSAAVQKFIRFKLQEQNTFWSFITDAPAFRYGGSFVFSDEMQEKALAVKMAIKDFELALEKRQKKNENNSRG